MLRRVILSCVLLASGFAAGLLLTARTESRASELQLAPAAVQSPAPSRQAVERPPALSPTGGMMDFSRVAAQAVKGVANISSLQVVRTTGSPFGSDPFFRYFFDDEG